MKNQDPFQKILQRRWSRRGVLLSGCTAAAITATAGCQSLIKKDLLNDIVSDKAFRLTFQELPQGLDEELTVPEGYRYQVLLRWGDPLFNHVPEFDPQTQTAAKQEMQFGYNNDFVGFLPLPLGSSNNNYGILVVNHEYTHSKLMFPEAPEATLLTKAQTDIDIAAHGLSIVVVKRQQNLWQVVRSAPYTRRITPLTPMQFTGPVVGHHRIQTRLSPNGRDTLGTYANCAGCVTPWGTVLTCEENIDWAFSGEFANSEEAESLHRFGMQVRQRRSWAKYYARWDLSQSPRESLHMGWVVEIDPYNPTSKPRKHSALGRFKHEGCAVHINSDGRIVAYSGDDQEFEYLYKFVSQGRYQPNNRALNLELLTAGTLYCAKFNDDGSMNWLPLIFGQGPLIASNGFKHQADVILDTRKAADLSGATPMDRPEEISVNPVSGAVFVMLTGNKARTESQIDAVNPRANNRAGQIVELIPPNGDHTALEFYWDMFLIAGPRDDPSTLYHPNVSANGWLACPDNCTFDHLGNLWIASDGAEKFGVADGLWACEVTGPNRALTKRFMRVPRGAELCGPFFTKDSSQLFCSVQHPGGRSNYHEPDTRWPDFNPKLPPRPAVVVVSKKDGSRIGS